MILNVLLTIYGGLAFAGILFMATLHYFHDQRGYYKTATWIWLGIFLGFVGDGLVSEKFGPVHHLFGFPFMSIAMYATAHLTARVYRFELPYRKLMYFSFVSWLTGVFLHYFVTTNFAVSAIFICLAITAPTIFSGLRMLQSWNRINVIDRIFCGVVWIQTIHTLDYPFLRNVESASLAGFSLGLILMYLASILIPVIINRRLSEELHISLEEKVIDRTKELMNVQTKLVNSAKMAALGEMAGGIAHEINNPLAIIKNTSSLMSELIEEDPVEKETLRKMATVIEQTTDRIANIVKSLRFFSRDGSLDLNQSVQLKKLVDKTLILCTERFKYYDIPITVENISEQIYFEGREVEVSQVLLNLINNAFDAIENQKEKWIKISAQDQDSWIEIRITDSGTGIPENIRKRIFQPFFTTKEVGKGTGMGLSVSLGIIQNHRGELRIDTEAKNTCFIIRLPKRQDQPLPRMQSEAS